MRHPITALLQLWLSSPPSATQLRQRWFPALNPSPMPIAFTAPDSIRASMQPLGSGPTDQASEDTP